MNFGYRIKSNTTSLEQTKLEKDYYERLQNIQNEVSSELPKYIKLRDRHFANHRDYQTDNEYFVLMTKLAASIAQYNRLEVKLSELERRKVRWFVVPVPPLAPQNLRIETSPGGRVSIVSDVLVPDPLAAKVSEDVKAIFEDYGQQPPSSNETRSRNSP